ncbi:MAG: oligosaccharide flippase family protein [Nitrospirae bacterium]|nr:oligosaccharide flippase family protein [Nitrospirota bacterium]
MAEAEQRKDSSLIKIIAGYSASSIFSKIFGVFYSFLKPKLLSPELYGLWNLLNLIPTYAAYVHLGSRSSMQYRIPYHLGAGEETQSNQIKDTVFYATLILNLIIAVFVAVIALAGNFSIVETSGLLVMSVMIILIWYEEYTVSLLKAYQDFKLLTSLTYLMTVAKVFSGILFLYLWGIYGLYLSIIFSYIVILAFIIKNCRPSINKGFQLPIFKELVHHGFPIMLFNFSNILISTADRFVISHFLGIKQLGYYSFAVTVFTFMIQIPGAAREVIEPRLMSELNNKSKQAVLDEYLFKPLINTAYYLPFIIGPIVFAIPVLTTLLFPKYTEAIVPAQIMTIGGYFFSLSYLTRGIIVANNWQLKASAIVLFICLLNTLTNIFLLSSGIGIAAVAAVSSISYFLLFATLLFFALKRYACTASFLKSNAIALCLPSCFMCLCFLASEYASKTGGYSPYISAFASIVIYMTGMILLIISATKINPHLKGLKIRKPWTKK